MELRETHISVVLLTGDRAFKLKKPLTLPFLDYGTPDRRRACCELEVELNRRLAGDIYLGVRAVVETAGGLMLAPVDAENAIDYVVEMRRFDEARTFAALLARGELEQGDVVAAGRLLARFHEQAAPAGSDGSPVAAARQELDANFAELIGLMEPRGLRDRVIALWRFANRFVATHEAVLVARSQRGALRDGHGDLRAEHVLAGDPPQIVDCVEFDPALRHLDVADDLAFLVMDLAALGGERFAAALVDAYREAGGDVGSDALLALYACHRALVRTKVLLLRSRQLPAGAAAQATASAGARDLVWIAERFAWRARMPLAIAVCGVPASGKSHLARALVEASGLVRVSSDETRKRLAELPSTERGGPEHYTDAFNHATYTELGRRAAAEIARNGGAVVDATFRRREDRDAFRAGFGSAAPVLFVECRAPEEALLRRAAARERSPQHESDATVAIVARELARFEALDEVPAECHVALRTDRRTGALVAELIAAIDERAAWGLPRISAVASHR